MDNRAVMKALEKVCARSKLVLEIKEVLNRLGRTTREILWGGNQ